VPLYLVTNLTPRLAFARPDTRKFTPAWFSRSHADSPSPSTLRSPAPSNSDSSLFAYALHSNTNLSLQHTSFTCQEDPSKRRLLHPACRKPDRLTFFHIRLSKNLH